MPSVKNPNMPSRNRLAAQAGKARKAREKKSAAAATRVTKADARRGARPGLLPTSGPKARISAKKQRKLERMLGYAMKRKAAAEGEVEMQDAPVTKDAKKKNEKADSIVEMQ